MKIKKNKWAWGAGLAAALALLLLLGLACLPMIINLQPIKDSILDDLSRKIGGRVSGEKIDVALLPAPHLTIRKMQVAKENRFAGSLESLIAYPQIFPLMRGQVKLTRMRLVAPDLAVWMAEESAAGGETTPRRPMMARLREQLTAALGLSTLYAPALFLEIENGSVTIAAENKPPLHIASINGSIQLPPAGFRIQLTCRSGLWKSFTATVEVGSDLTTQGLLQVDDLQPQVLGQWVAPPLSTTMANSSVNLNVEFASKNLETLHLDFQGTAPRLQIVQQDETVRIDCENLQASLDLDKDGLTIDLAELRLNYPRLNLSGQFLRHHNPCRYQLALKATELDADATRQAALALLGRFSVVRKIFQIVRGGTVPEITFSTHGSSARDLGKAENIHIVGSMHNGKIFVPAAELDLTEVFGEVDISRGILQGDKLRARLENSTGTDAYLRLGLTGGDAPFHLDIIIDADLAQLPPILVRVVNNALFDQEMEHIQSLAGTATGRLILGESLDSVKALVDVKDIKLNAAYARLPYPLEITNGEFSYDGIEETVSVKDLSGTLGKSTFSAFSAALGWSDRFHLQVEAANVNLSVDEVYPWITSYATPRRILKEFKFENGRIEVARLTLTGPLLQPATWQFETSGTMQDLAVQWTSFPDTLMISNGKFRGVPDKLVLTDTRGRLLDAAFKATAELDEFRKGLLAADLKIGGQLGAKTIKWIAGLSNLPAAFYFRPPLVVADGHLIWERDVKTTFMGVVTPNNGPKVTIDQTWQKEDYLSINKLLIQDAESNALISADLKPEALELTFSGKLTKNTVDQLLQNNDMLWGWINGDFTAHFFFTQYMASTAQGSLQGERINFPAITGLEQIQNFSIHANGKSIQVDAATILWEDNKLETNGSVVFSRDGFLLDLDVKSGGIDWSSISKIFQATRHSAAASSQLERLHILGEIRFVADFFAFEHYTLQPLEASILLMPQESQVRVTNAKLCGISLPGLLKISHQKKTTVEFTPQAHNLQLKETLVCLWDNNGLMVGDYSFDADMKGYLSDNRFIKTLSGEFDFHSDNGRIYRFGLLEKIFSVLNFTEIFRGRLPDLAQEGFGYDSVQIEGTLNDGRMDIAEAIIKGTSLEMVGRGSVDLTSRSINLTFLVAPLKTFNVIMNHIPVVGGILGTIVSVPVQVTGDLENPVVIPLSPTAVGSELLGLMKKTLELPLKIIQPLMQQSDNDRPEETPRLQEPEIR